MRDTTIRTALILRRSLIGVRRLVGVGVSADSPCLRLATPRRGGTSRAPASDEGCASILAREPVAHSLRQRTPDPSGDLGTAQRSCRATDAVWSASLGCRHS